MDFIYSTEFYIIAFLIAVFIAAFFFRPRRIGDTKTYFAKGAIRYNAGFGNSIVVKCDDIGSITLLHSVYLPEGAEASLQAIVDEDKGSIKLLEKTFPLLPDSNLFQCEIVYILPIKSFGKTHILFESESNSTIGTGKADLTPPCRVTIDLQK